MIPSPDMSPIIFAAAILATLSSSTVYAQGSTGSMTGCDDCFTQPAPLSYGTAYFGGSQYGAFSVCSNGYMVLLGSTSDTIRGYSYNPQPISQSEGSPLIAPFWSDVNLACPGTANTVRYYETCDGGFLSMARGLSQDSNFYPSYALVVEYDAVQAYTCPISCDTNTYTIILATDPGRCKTYAIYQYQTMTWSRATTWSNPPTVGYGNGQCQGRQVNFGGYDPASYVQQCEVLAYRVDQSFSEQVQVQNKGTVARQQKEDAARVVMQSFAEKNGEPGSEVSMQEKLGLALQNAAEEKNHAIIQNFNK